MRHIQTIDLNGKWQITQLTDDGAHKVGAIIGQVPGVVHADLLRLKLVADPLYRQNEVEQQWVGEAAWEYRRSLDISAEQLAAANVVLRADGLDTIAEVFVNGTKVAATDNMFIGWRWDVKRLLKPGKNDIRIVFSPVRPEMEKRWKDYWITYGDFAQAPWHPKHRNHVRKSHTQGGWDWGPAFLTPGIWRPMSIECYDGPRLLACTHQQTHAGGDVQLTVTAIIESASGGSADVSVQVAGSVARTEARLQPGENKIALSLKIGKPDLWWPNGYGQQPLHDLVTTVTSGPEAQSLRQRIGFRDLRLVREKDQAGESFYFQVNGVPIFAKGNNWIPSDSFDCTLSDDEILWELKSAVAAHNNMLRVWGGGIYERDRFYEMCDELGLLIWQDFLFACHLYPVGNAFLESVRTEVRQNVRRLQHHASLALWCGNNECEQAIGWHGNRPEKKQLHLTFVAEYDHLYMQTIHPIVREEDPGRAYWPSSPSNGVRVYGDPQDQTRGDMHYWGVWHGGQPFPAYLDQKPRFSSEFGFQSFAAPELFDTYTLPEDRNITSPVMEHFQRCGGGNQKILNHISLAFRVPVGWENTVYMSQVLQALSIKVACEHWRRIKPHNMGTLIWQLNDIWPAASWASLDYEGRWNMVHYFERKFFAPLLVSAVKTDKGVEIWATSDINEPLTGTLELDLRDFAGKSLARSSQRVELPALASQCVKVFNLEDVAESLRNKSILQMKLTCGQHVAANEHLFVAPKALELSKPRITWDLSQKHGAITMAIRADTFAPYVWIRHGDIHGVWSDNGMHLQAGEERELTFTPRTSASVEDLRRVIQIHDLRSAGY